MKIFQQPLQDVRMTGRFASDATCDARVVRTFCAAFRAFSLYMSCAAMYWSASCGWENLSFTGSAL